MGQKARPTGLRLGITEEWRSRWFASKREFSKLVVEDFRLREYINGNYAFAAIAKVEIERNAEEVKVILYSARPGLVIGRKGQEVENLKKRLEKMTGRQVNIQIQEVPKPELNAQLVSQNVMEQLKKRSPFRRTIKRTVEQTMNAGAKGVRVRISGRLGGAEMSRTEQQAAGSIPLQTLRAKVDYGFSEAHTTYGHIGIKVWVCTGEEREREVVYGLDAKKSQAPQEPARSSEGPGQTGQQG